MQRFKYHYKNIILYDLLNKHNYTNNFQIPTLKNIKIVLNYTNVNKKNIVHMLLILKLICNTLGKINILNKKNSKIKKSLTNGCKILLNNNDKFLFLEQLIIFIFPNVKEFNGFNLKKSNNILNFKIKNIINFFGLQNEFFFLNNYKNILITVETNSKTFQETELLLNSFNFPIKKRI